MRKIYEKPIQFWDDVFKSKKVKWPEDNNIPINDLDDAVNWVVKGSESLLDFGCGNGVMLMYAMNKGIKKGIGIDLSKEAIQSAISSSNMLENVDIQFIHGSIDALKNVVNQSFDAIICSNIIDNLTEEDALELLDVLSTRLKSGGKLLVKMNPYIKESEFKTNNISRIKDDLLDDGLLLLNKTNKSWKLLWDSMFQTVYEGAIYYEEHDMENRVFYLEKKS